MNLQTLSKMIDVFNPIQYRVRHICLRLFYTLEILGVGFVSGANYRHIDRYFYYLYFNVSNKF